MGYNLDNKNKKIDQYIRLFPIPQPSDKGYVKVFFLDDSSGNPEGLYYIDDQGNLSGALLDTLTIEKTGNSNQRNITPTLSHTGAIVEVTGTF